KILRNFAFSKAINGSCLMHRNKPLITPETKVGELLTHYPELEELLLQFSPAFATLKNPILRRTVAQVTSLRQAAKVGNANIVEMVNSLRQAAGQSISDENSLIESENARVALVGKAPTAITFTLDVRPVLEKGEHPKELVMKEANRLQAGECMELLTPFPPVPLIELLEKKGFAVTMVEPGDGVVRTFIHR
ncbi:DUF1858 domain-containing protein, partial [Tannerella forsythia]